MAVTHRPADRPTGAPPQPGRPVISDDLYTKIALDNKLVTQFYLRKATEEQEKLDREGEKLDLGAVMVKLGILTDRQHQSVVNACLYREQRDYDKRFGRQCLRMSITSQEKIEEALSAQKNEYMKSGSVRPMSDFLVELGSLTKEQVSQVHDGIVQRDKAKEAARSGRNPGVSSATVPALGATGKTKTAPPPPPKAKKRDSGESDVDDAELEDDDLEDVDLDDEDLDDVDLDEGDLDADLDDDDGDLDADLDDGDLDDGDLDAGDLDDGELEGADLDEVEQELKAASGDASGKGALDEDEPKVDLEDLDLDPDQDGQEDEEDLAEDVSEVDSEVDLDDDDLKALEEMDSGEQVQEDTSWAADAFDDRPLDKRAPSERLAAAPPPPPPPPPPPAAPPVVPAPAGSGRMPRWMKAAQAGKAKDSERAKAGAAEPPPPPAPIPAARELAETASEIDPPPPSGAASNAVRTASGRHAGHASSRTASADEIPGGDVFEGNISEERPIPVELRGDRKRESARTEARSSGRHKSARSEAKPEKSKTSGRLSATSTREKRGASARQKAVKAPSDVAPLPADVVAPSDLAPPSDLDEIPTLINPSDLAREEQSGSGITLDLDDLTDLDDEPGAAKSKPAASAGASARLPDGLDEAALRRAFDRAVSKAMESAWQAFLKELKG